MANSAANTKATLASANLTNAKAKVLLQPAANCSNYIGELLEQIRYIERFRRPKFNKLNHEIQLVQ